MGAEAKCTATISGKKTVGKALLETDELIFRGDDVRLTIPYKSVSSIDVKDGVLHVAWLSGVASFELGPSAVKWADRIRNPPGAWTSPAPSPGSNSGRDASRGSGVRSTRPASMLVIGTGRPGGASSAACALDAAGDAGVLDDSGILEGSGVVGVRNAIAPPGASDQAAAASRLAAIALMPANQRRRARSASARCFSISAAWAARSTRASSEDGAAAAASSATNAAHARALCTSSGRSGVMPGIGPA